MTQGARSAAGPRAVAAELRVVAHRRLEELAPRAAELDALNLASRRPCPFATSAYLRTFLAHDEYARPDDEVLFLTATDGDRLVGYLPLRRRVERLLGVPCVRIGVLVDHDTDRPHVVARAEDEARCSDAFYAHLLAREPGWTFLELAFQDADSALLRVPPLPASYYRRTFESMPNATIPLPFATVREYFGSLGKNTRHNASRLGRRLLGAGAVEVIACGDARARTPLLDLYLDVERRSWKHAAGAGIARDARRVAFFRDLCGPAQPLALRFQLVLLDGLPIAALLSGAFAGTDYWLETTFDQAYEDLGPGHLLNVTSIGSALSRGARACNLNGNYAYYKSEWGGAVTETRAVQIYRAPSLHWLKARAGELRRRILPPPPPARRSNPARTQAAPRGGAREPVKRPERREERERAAAVLARLTGEGVRLERLSGAALAAALPFDAPPSARAAP